MKVTSKSETTHQRGWSGLFVVSVVVCFSLVSSSSHGKSAAEVLSAYKGLTGSQREQKLIEGAKREGTLQLPRFKMEYKAELKKPLMALGMQRAFRPGAADFSGMTGTPLYVDAVKHKSFVEVNEEGTEAAAATGVTMKMTAVAPGPRPFQMIVDHPFVFVIEDQPSHTILFLGEILDP